jgi:septum site-determining protein MinD
MTKVIAVVAAKGGVGKTTTAINLGTALAAFRREAIVLDGNLATPDIGIHLGAPVVPFSVHDAIAGKKSIRDCVYMHPSGVRIAPASISLAAAKSADHVKLAESIKELNGTGELVIVDTASGIGRGLLSVAGAADEAIIVTTADLPSVTSALKTVSAIEEEGTTVVGVVINRVRNDRLEMSPHEIEAMVERPVIASIPEDRNIAESLKKNHPVVYMHPDSPSSVAYKKLAALLIGQKYQVLSKKGGN